MKKLLYIALIGMLFGFIAISSFMVAFYFYNKTKIDKVYLAFEDKVAFCERFPISNDPQALGNDDIENRFSSKCLLAYACGTVDNQEDITKVLNAQHKIHARYGGNIEFIDSLVLSQNVAVATPRISFDDGTSIEGVTKLWIKHHNQWVMSGLSYHSYRDNNTIEDDAENIYKHTCGEELEKYREKHFFGVALDSVIK